MREAQSDKFVASAQASMRRSSAQRRDWAQRERSPALARRAKSVQKLTKNA